MTQELTFDEFKQLALRTESKIESANVNMDAFLALIKLYVKVNPINVKSILLLLNLLIIRMLQFIRLQDIKNQISERFMNKNIMNTRENILLQGMIQLQKVIKMVNFYIMNMEVILFI